MWQQRVVQQKVFNFSFTVFVTTLFFMIGYYRWYNSNFISFKEQICGNCFPKWKLLHTLYFFLTKFIYCLHVIYVVCVCILFVYNLLQKIVDKFTNSSKKGFFCRMVYSWFFAIFLHKCQNLPISWPAGYSPSNPSISGIFIKFANFLYRSVTFKATLKFTLWC